MVDAVSNTSRAAMIERALVGREAMLQARSAPMSSPAFQASAPPAARAAAPATDAADKRGSVESENIQMATGMAKAARTNIETLNMGVSVYNGAARMLADTDKIEDLRRWGGEKAVDVFVKMHKQAQTVALRLMNSASGMMAREFTIAGTPVTRAEDGSYKVGEYIQSAGEAGWSVSVKSNGQASAIANRIDVSARVDDSSASGFRWSSLGQSVDIAA